MKRILLTVAILIYASVLFAQRPKVGLVLSGGGAKGLSHIGILQAIDSAGLKIDYLTGTSMGSVIGGLYAIGYSGKDIEKIAYKLDWDVLLSNKPSYTDISIDEKDEYGRYSFELGVKNFKPQIATGLIESEELWLTLNDLFLPVYDVKDFSKFNIPFKCISTDLSNGKAVVHSKGEIVKAIRSSMAIPSVFTAIEYDSTKLVDGGIVRNFPVTDIKDMNADIVIGVNLFKGLPDVSKLNNALDVFYQITQYRDADDLIKEKERCNLVIEPPVEAYTAGSFGESEAIIKIGKEVGKLYYPYFKHLADSLNKIDSVAYNPTTRLPQMESIIVDDIEFRGIVNTSKNLLMDKLDIHSGNSYTAAQINTGFRKAFSTRYYNNVFYELKPTEKGHAKLVCLIKEAPLTQAKVGLSYHTYTGFAVIANVTIRDLLLTKSRTMVKVAFGDYFRGLVQHRQAFGKRANNYLNLSYGYDQLPLNIYNGADKKAVYNINTSTTDLNLTKVVNINWSFTIGTNYQNIRFSPEVTSDLRFKGNVTQLYSYIRSESKTINSPNFPTRGHDFMVEAGINFNRDADVNAYVNDTNKVDVSSTINDKPDLYRFRMNYTQYHHIYKKSAFFYTVQGGYVQNSQGFIFDELFLGGVQKVFRTQMPFVGAQDGQIVTRGTAIAMLGMQYNIAGNFLLIGRANATLYDKNTGSDPLNARFLSGFSLGLGYDLGMLPIELTMMYSPELGVLYSHVKLGFIF